VRRQPLPVIVPRVATAWRDVDGREDAFQERGSIYFHRLPPHGCISGERERIFASSPSSQGSLPTPVGQDLRHAKYRAEMHFALRAVGLNLRLY
jgi:hypothetical protein